MAAKEFNRYFDRSIFEDQNDCVLVKSQYFDGTAATANQSLVAAVTGKKIRIISMLLTSNGAQSSVLFKNGSGGTNLMVCTIPANTVAEPNVIWPFDPCGIVESSSGVGIFVDVGAVRVLGGIRYIEVTP